jgi:hypothetical protein
MIKTNLDKLNSAAKYPSILTYHELGDKGSLVNNVQVEFNDPVILTEKIDGTNARIILFYDKSYFIGSREELLTASGDLIYNPSMGIVDTLRPLMSKFNDINLTSYVWIFFGEVYGLNINNAKNYTSCRAPGFRLFDVAYYDSEYDFDSFLVNNSIQSISFLRDHGHQKFLNEQQFQDIARKVDIPIVPRLESYCPPKDLIETFAWLKTMLPGKTNAPIDGEGGKPEGIVVRTSDRSKIAKIRFEDYERTIKKLKCQMKNF